MSLNAKSMLHATLSNYIHLLIKIVSSLLLVRIMFLGMQQEAYGFWALLWSIFGYSVLLEFGLGVTIQKKTAELFASENLEKLSALFSTYLLVYSLIACIIIFSSVILSLHLDTLFVISDMHRLEEYALTLLIFGIGSGASFALGFGVEILRGLHLLKIRNYINTFFVILNALLLWQCVVYEQALYVYALVAVSIQFCNNLAFMIVLKRRLPSLRFSLSLVDFQDLRNSLGFSLSAYLVMFSNILIFRTDQIIISAVAGVSFVGLYQIASRVADLFRQFATQFHESLGTKAAMLHATKDKTKLSQLLIHSNKIVAAIASVLFIPAFILIEPLLFLWLELRDSDAILCAKILLISMYILVVFRSSMVQILLMNGLHKQLMRIGLLEAFLNISLSIFLVQHYGMLGAAIGTLIPNILLALFYNIPVALQYASTQLKDYILEYLLPLFISFVSSLYLGVYLQGLVYPDSLLYLALHASALILFFSLSYALCNYKTLFRSQKHF